MNDESGMMEIEDKKQPDKSATARRIEAKYPACVELRGERSTAESLTRRKEGRAQNIFGTSNYQFRLNPPQAALGDYFRFTDPAFHCKLTHLILGS